MTVDMLTGHDRLATTRDLTDRLLDRYLPSESTEPTTLHAAMRYSVMAGGKRLRPMLALAAYEYCDGSMEHADRTIYPAMAALEMVHTFSLIHDDLPCMDDDDLRRGRPTCHKQFGEAIAVLAGDALQVLAFRLMASTGSPAAVTELADAIGSDGMLGGQVGDLEAEGRVESLTRADIEQIHRRKTGALIRSSVRIGAILAKAPESQVSALTRYGENVGLAFQIVDDVLDIEGDEQRLGKIVGSDSKNAKATYPGVVGMAAAKEDAHRLITDALAVFGPQDDNQLIWLANFIARRES